MSIQVKFYLSDFKKHLLKSSITLLQFIVVLCLMTYISKALLEYGTVKKTIEEMTKEKQIYMLDNATEDYHFNQLINDKQYYPKMMELDAFVQSSADLTSYVADTSMSIPVDKKLEIPKGVEESSYRGIKQLSCISITSNFIKVFKLKGNFEEYDVIERFKNYKIEDKLIPVVMGYTFKGHVKENNIFQDTQGKTYLVLGFLDKGSRYIAPNRSEGTISLDNYVIVPYQITHNDSLSYSFNFFSTYYITNDKSQVRDIVEKSNELGLYSLKLSSFEKQMQYIRLNIIEKVLFNSTLCIIILIMSVIGLMGNLMQFITEYMSEFAVHLLCGAREADIALRIGIQIAVLIFGANIVDFAILGVNISSLMTAGMSILLGVLILIYPIVKIFSQSIMPMIRRNTL